MSLLRSRWYSGMLGLNAPPTDAGRVPVSAFTAGLTKLVIQVPPLTLPVPHAART